MAAPQRDRSASSNGSAQNHDDRRGEGRGRGRGRARRLEGRVPAPQVGHDPVDRVPEGACGHGVGRLVGEDAQQERERVDDRDAVPGHRAVRLRAARPDDEDDEPTHEQPGPAEVHGDRADGGQTDASGVLLGGLGHAQTLGEETEW